MSRPFLLLLLSSMLSGTTTAFVPSLKNQAVVTGCSSSSTARHFGIPSFTPKRDDDDKEDAAEKKIGWSGLAQLITAGMGSPFLGDFEGVDEETGKFMFSLEANNLVDENGESKQTKMAYFESGWVDEEEEARKKEAGFKFPWQQ